MVIEPPEEAWFDNDQKVRHRCGLSTAKCVSPAPSSLAGPKACSICMSAIDDLIALDCGHGFCAECWKGYLHTQVDDGKSAVKTRCPQHKCSIVVPTKFFLRYCDEERQKNLEIHCSCSFVWCWACGEEAHKPASCKTVNQWNVKNSAESENISWIRAHTKKCPKCHKPIEKNQGCNHMVCSKAPEKALFEYLQKNLEEKTDCLHEMLEKDLDKSFFDQDNQFTSEEAHQKFMTFRSHATNFTNVTQKFLTQILSDLGSETGLGQRASQSST
eukprot:Skav200324  [mRNA]  locus=scaffold1760:105811:111894:- [translate_table: standard]